MSKRGASETSYNKRKRKKNGISSSTSLLGGPVDAPPSKPKKSMRAWHTNVEDPYTVRRSAVPIPCGHQDQGVEATEAGGEDLTTTVSVLESTPKKPKRKRGNDSVSHHWFKICGRLRYQFPPVDKDGRIPLTQAGDS